MLTAQQVKSIRSDCHNCSSCDSRDLEDALYLLATARTIDDALIDRKVTRVGVVGRVYRMRVRNGVFIEFFWTADDRITGLTLIC